MESIRLFQALSEDLANEAVTPPFDTYERGGYGDELTYYVALQGESADQKLLVLLRVGGDHERPDVLWTYGPKTE